MKEAWWLDLVEGEIVNNEIDKEKFKNVEVLPQRVLENSKIFKEMSALKDFIKFELDTVLPEDAHYFQELQNKIMSNIRHYECKKQEELHKREKSDNKNIAKFKDAKLYFSLGL